MIGISEKNDRKRAVYRLQRQLMCLHNAGYPLPPVVPDGIFDKATEDAVFAFQGLSGLRQTGKVDEETWASLERAAKEEEDRAAISSPIYPFEYLKRGTVGPNDRSDLTYIVQVMLRTLEGHFSCLESQSVNGMCDETTERNIKSLQKIWHLSQTGEIDRKTWEMLAAAYNKYLNRE